MNKLIVCVGFVCLILALLVGGVSALSVTVDAPTTGYPANEITTVPVTIHGADDILGFVMGVYNNIDGVVITLNQSKPLSYLSGCNYVFNSVAENECQYVLCDFTEPLSGDAEIFSIDVLPQTAEPSSLEIVVGISEIYDANNNDLAPSVVKTASVVNLDMYDSETEDEPVVSSSDSVTSSQTGTSIIKETTVSTPMPTTTVIQNDPTVKPTASPTQATSAPVVNPTAMPTAMPTQQSPAPVFGLIAGVFCVLAIMKGRR